MSDKIKSVSSKKTSYYIHTLIILLFTFGFGQLPPFGEITTQGCKLSVFFWVYYGAGVQ